MFEKSILVTGGAGFIGTNFVAYFARTYPNYRLIDLDALTYAGSRCAFDAQKQMPNVVPVEGDIRNAELVTISSKNTTSRASSILPLKATSTIPSSILCFLSTPTSTEPWRC